MVKILLRLVNYLKPYNSLQIDDSIDTATRVQILAETDCISHSTNTLMGKVWIQLFSLQLWGNSRTDCVLQPW